MRFRNGMKAATWVIAVLLLGGRSDAGKFVQVNETCTSSTMLFCLKENFGRFCIDLENFTVDWKIDFSCLMQSTEDDQCVSTSPSCEATEDTTLYTETTTTETTTETAEIPTQTTTETTTEIITETTSTTTEKSEEEDISTATEEPTTTEEPTSPPTKPPTPPPTLTPLPTGPPSCPSASIGPGTSCDTYYECISVWWWFEPRLNTCASGQLFSITQNKCVPAAQSDCVD